MCVGYGVQVWPATGKLLDLLTVTLRDIILQSAENKSLQNFRGLLVPVNLLQINRGYFKGFKILGSKVLIVYDTVDVRILLSELSKQEHS